MTGMLLVFAWVTGTLTSYLMWDAATIQKNLGRSFVYALLSVVLLALPLAILIGNP